MFSDWDVHGQGLIDSLNEQTWWAHSLRNVEFVCDDSYDYAISFNYAHTSEPDRTIGLLLEPEPMMNIMYPKWREFDPSPYLGYYSFSGVAGYKPAYGVGFATAPLQKYPKPTKRACMVISGKRFTPWHHKRGAVFSKLVAAGLDIDFYGRGMPVKGRKMGELPPMDKHSTIHQYEMVIDFENAPGAVTDKFFDPVICGATPISNQTGVDCRDEFHWIDFEASDDEIVDQVAEAIDAGPINSTNLLLQVAAGKMSLGHWILSRLIEIDPSIKVDSHNISLMEEV